MIETEHNGYQIRFRQESDLWRCHDLDLQHEKLSSLKTLINKIETDLRRVSNVKAIVINGRWGKKFEYGVITLIASDEDVWVNMVDGNKGVRKKLSIENLTLNTPENVKAIKLAHNAEAASLEAQRKAREALAAIPRLTLEDLKGLADVED